MNVLPSRSLGHVTRDRTLWRRIRRGLSLAAPVSVTPLLGGCQLALMDPKGPIGAEEKPIILLATGLMLIVHSFVSRPGN